MIRLTRSLAMLTCFLLPAIGVRADDDAAVAVALMRQHAVRRLPVIEDGQVAGIVSLGDLAPPDLS